MKKLRLDLAELKVDSYVTSDAGREGEGTVFAMANTVCHISCAPHHGDTCDGEGAFCYSDPCGDYTNPDLQSCTGDYEVTEQPDCTGNCATGMECSEEVTVCCGPTD